MEECKVYIFPAHRKTVCGRAPAAASFHIIQHNAEKVSHKFIGFQQLEKMCEKTWLSRKIRLTQPRDCGKIE
jgi:hypothetical protein